MIWFDWALAGWLALTAVLSVALIGVPRNPITPGAAIATLLINGAIIAGVVLVR